MVNYQNGKIYKLISSMTDKIYVGSTCLPYLCQRLGNHKNASNTSKSKEMLQYDDVKIVLLEAYPCNSKDELLTREQHYIDLNKDICINDHRAIGFDHERRKAYKKLNDKIYAQTDHYKNYQKEYRIKNAEKNKEYQKQYRLKRV
jgi:hypothetical protein